MSRAYRRFGLERDPFLDTSDPHFFWEMPAVARAKAKLLSSIEESRGLTVVIGDPGSGKTSLALAVETTLLVRDDVLLGKILDPHFASETEFLLAVGRAFGLMRHRTRFDSCLPAFRASPLGEKSSSDWIFCRWSLSRSMSYLPLFSFGPSVPRFRCSLSVAPLFGLGVP